MGIDEINTSVREFYKDLLPSFFECPKNADFTIHWRRFKEGHLPYSRQNMIILRSAMYVCYALLFKCKGLSLSSCAAHVI